MKDSNLVKFFEPLNIGYFSSKKKWQSTQIGYLIEPFLDQNFPDLKFCEMAIFNVNEYNGTKNDNTSELCSVRKCFYNLHIKNIPRIADLGYLNVVGNRKENFKIIIDVCYQLINNGTLPIIIGGGHDISYAIYKAHAKFKKKISYTCIDNKLDIGLIDDILSNSSHLSKIIKAKPNFLFNYTNLGYQSFFVSPHALDMMDSMGFSYSSLGDVRADIKKTEPVLRDTDMITLDISSISNMFSKANCYSTPNGFNGDEICKISFYAGISDRVKSFGLFEYNQNLDDNQTAQIIAQIIWYFINGYSKRVGEIIPSSKNLVFYNVTFEDEKNTMLFCKSKLTNRWWIVLRKDHKYNKFSIDQFFACSYEDYNIAMKGEIPDSWLRILKFIK